MGSVLVDRVDTEQEIIICMANLMDKMENINKKIIHLTKTITDIDPSILGIDGEPQLPYHESNLAE